MHQLEALLRCTHEEERKIRRHQLRCRWQQVSQLAVARCEVMWRQRQSSLVAERKVRVAQAQQDMEKEEEIRRQQLLVKGGGEGEMAVAAEKPDSDEQQQQEEEKEASGDGVDKQDGLVGTGSSVDRQPKAEEGAGVIVDRSWRKRISVRRKTTLDAIEAEQQAMVVRARELREKIESM